MARHDSDAQLLLPFEYGEQEREPEEAPEEPLPFFAEPKNDNERLLNYQYHAKHGDDTAFTAMYRLGCRIALRYINKKARGNKHLASLSAETRQEKAHNAITYVITRYCKAHKFYIKSSFTAYLYRCVLRELFYRRKVDSIVSFVAPQDLYKEHEHDDKDITDD